MLGSHPKSAAGVTWGQGAGATRRTNGLTEETQLGPRRWGARWAFLQGWKGPGGVSHGGQEGAFFLGNSPCSLQLPPAVREGGQPGDMGQVARGGWAVSVLEDARLTRQDLAKVTQLLGPHLDASSRPQPLHS